MTDPRRGEQIDSKNASRLSFEPISVKSGPTSLPSLFTMWQVLHLPMVLKTTLPFSALPFAFSNCDNGGSG